MARKEERIEELKNLVIETLEEIPIGSSKKQKYLRAIERWAKEGNEKKLLNFYSKLQKIIERYGEKKEKEGQKLGEEKISSDETQISGKTTKRSRLKGGEELSITEEAVERMSQEEGIKSGTGKIEPDIKTKSAGTLEGGRIFFDARPHIAFFSIASRDPKVKSLRSLVLEDWVNAGDPEKRIVLHSILGGSEEVKNFFNTFKKEFLQSIIDYEAFIDEGNKKIILKVPEKYHQLEQAITQKLKEIYGIYGENELTRFLRAGLINQIIQDRNFPFHDIWKNHGNYGISLEIGEMAREDTGLTLKELVKKGFSPESRTFTEQLRTTPKGSEIMSPLDEFIKGIKKGYFLPFFRDNPGAYQTIEGVILQDIKIGKAFEEGNVRGLPFGENPELTKKFRGFIEASKVETHWKIIRQVALDAIQNKKYQSWLPHFFNLLGEFPEVIWDYVSRYKYREMGGSELMKFLNFITSPDYKKEFEKGNKMTYWEAYKEVSMEKGIDLSKVPFPKKVSFFLNKYVEPIHGKKGTSFKINRGELEKLFSNERIMQGGAELEKFANEMDRVFQDINNAVKNIVVEGAPKTTTEVVEDVLGDVLPRLQKVAEDYGYEIDSNALKQYISALYKSWEQYGEVVEQIDEFFKSKTPEELNRIIREIFPDVPPEVEKRIKEIFSEGGIEKAFTKDMDKVGELLGERVVKSLDKSLLKVIYLKRLAKFGVGLGGLIGIGYGIYHLFKKKKEDKKEEVKPPVPGVEAKGEGTAVSTETEEFKPIYLFPNLWNEYKLARENYKQAVQSYSRGIMNFILMSSIFANDIPDIPASDLIRLKVLAEWEGKDFSKLARGYVVAKRKGITPKTLAELEFYAGIEEPDRMKIDKIANMLEKIYNMNVKMNERLLMQAYDRYKMFMRANIDVIKIQFREWQKRQTLIEKAKLAQQNIARELGMLMAIEAYRKEEEGKEKAEAGR
jgi:hypothetical protein